MTPRAALPLFAFALAIACAVVAWPADLTAVFVLGAAAGALVALTSVWQALPEIARPMVRAALRSRVPGLR